ncbi:hypothetical protein FB451DRAFT_1523129 [Mycena latifolia]|nr:hypothetical protein FB451DRAFT_1523129 [Mycena latifolia]
MQRRSTGTARRQTNLSAMPVPRRAMQPPHPPTVPTPDINSSHEFPALGAPETRKNGTNAKRGKDGASASGVQTAGGAPRTASGRNGIRRHSTADSSRSSSSVFQPPKMTAEEKKALKEQRTKWKKGAGSTGNGRADGPQTGGEPRRRSSEEQGETEAVALAVEEARPMLVDAIQVQNRVRRIREMMQQMNERQGQAGQSVS